MFTDPTMFLIVAIITALAIIGLFGVLIGASIRYGIGEQDDQDGRAVPRGGSSEDRPPLVVSLELERARRNRDLGPAA